MAVTINTKNKKGPIIDPALCRCCHSIKKCRLLSTEYEWMGKKEVYSDMIMDCFGLLLSHLDGDNKDTCICATCVCRLREAYAFRQQVLQSEEVFMNAKLEGNRDDNLPQFMVELKVEPIEETEDTQMENVDDVIENQDEKPNLDIDVKIKKSSIKIPRRRSVRTKHVSSNPMNREGNKVRRRKVKMDDLLETEIQETKSRKAKKSIIDHEQMAYANTVTIVHNSYVCPFHNKLSHLEGGPEERLICATCVSRLREACAFRKQVLRCEELLLSAKIHLDNDVEESKEGIKADIKIESIVENEVVEKDHNNEAVLNSNNEPDVKSKKKSSVKKDKVLKRKRKTKVTVNKEKHELVTRMQKVKKLKDADVPEQKGNAKTKNTNDNEMMARHNTICIVENSYVCPFDTSFSDYFCIYCRKQFTDPNKLREHTMTHDPQIYKDLPQKKTLQIDILRIDCRLCTQRIDNIDDLKRHITSIHHKVLYPNIDNEFLKFRLTPVRLICTECDESFTFFHALKKHMAEHFGTCICDICGAHYFQERMLILHQKTHQKTDENYPCKECGKLFKSKHNRYLHIARTHKKEPAYPCTKCDEVLFSYTLRYRHMIEVHGIERLFECEQCDRTYDSRKSLREHNRRFHLKIFKHQCDLCDKRFYLPSRLKEHIASHSGERNFRCEYCGKSYPSVVSLKQGYQLKRCCLVQAGE
ncbi:Zinc finger protein 57 [Papilio xuthus]|uniref:Zinc finger protein 57 n=1 Tax=Papilio xuthus TaxID=66420 RepID=A0A0N1PGX7_PAPXU|nr:Zinc finger protein 57 [Papilio xuthus]